MGKARKKDETKREKGKVINKKRKGKKKDDPKR